jgi:hypothetical protein
MKMKVKALTSREKIDDKMETYTELNKSGGENSKCTAQPMKR